MFEEMSDNKCLPNSSADMKIKERLVYLFYELHRKSSPDNYCKLSTELGELLIFIKKNIRDFPDKSKQYFEYLLYLFKMIVQTRDIYKGKGERDVTYMLIYTWYKHYPVLAVNIIPFVIQYGCWRDICGICNYIYALSGDDSHPLIETCVEIMIQQLEKDENNAGADTGVSLAAKWVPREKRHNQWLFDAFVLQWSNKKWPHILNTSKYSCNAYYSAFNKCRMKFRKLISYLTKKIDIIETKQCANQWAKIHSRDVNIGTFISQKNCLFNIKNGKERTLDCNTDFAKQNLVLNGETEEKKCDRIQCSQNMQKIYKNGFPKHNKKYEVNFHSEGFGMKSESTFSIPITPSPTNVGDLTSILGMEKSDSRSLRSSANPISLCCEQGGPHFGWDAPTCLLHPKPEWRLNRQRCKKTDLLLSISINYFVKRAIKLLESREKHEKNKINAIYTSLDSSGSQLESKYIEKEIDLLNIQWKKYIRTINNLPNIIPIIDISSDYSDNELYNAIGLACIIAEKSLISKRVIVTHHEKMWVNLENCIDFVSMIQTIYNNYLSRKHKEDNNNLINSIKKILESIQYSNMTNENIKEMIFVIFQSQISNHDNISKLFSNFEGFVEPLENRRFSGQALLAKQNLVSKTNQPHFVYWNLSDSVSDTIENPCNISTCGITLISGNSPALINHLQFLGMASVRQLTPYNTLCNILDNNRYYIIEDLFLKMI